MPCNLVGVSLYLSKDIISIPILVYYMYLFMKMIVVNIMGFKHMNIH